MQSQVWIAVAFWVGQSWAQLHRADSEPVLPELQAFVCQALELKAVAWKNERQRKMNKQLEVENPQ